MKKALLGLLAVLLVVVTSARGGIVWQVVLADTAVALSSNCTNDTTFSFPDSTIAVILWDRNRNGRDDTLGNFQDSLALLCRNPPNCSGAGQDTVSFNSFLLNGRQEGLGRGKFFITTGLRAFGPQATPQWLPRPDSFYVRVCGNSMYWESEIFSPEAQATPQRIYLNHWRCVHRPPPCWEVQVFRPWISNFHASDSTHCDGILLEWSSHASSGDSIFLYRLDTLVARVSAADTSYMDSAALTNIVVRYSAYARHYGLCPTRSSQVFDNGYRCNVPDNVNRRRASNEVPTRTALLPSYPNPFNARTIIRFDLVRAERVRVTVYDLLGREIEELISGTNNAGSFSVVFDGSNLPSGVYICRMEADGFVAQQKLLLLK
jgi:hypothetical protein